MSEQKAFFEFCEELVEIPSVSDLDPKIDQSNLPLLEALANRLERLGMVVTITPLPNQPGKANLLAHFPESTPEVIFSGHGDTVPVNQGWQQDPFTLKKDDNGFWRGLGICDMKVLFPLFAAAVAPLAKERKNLPFGLLVTADEETTMDGARAILSDDNFNPKQIIIGEPTNGLPVMAHKGYMAYRVEARGCGGHASNPLQGENAIESMHRFIALLLKFSEQLKDRYYDAQFSVPYPTLNLGRVDGGLNLNTIADHCVLEFEIRPVPGSTPEAIDQALKQMLASFNQSQHYPLHLTTLYGAIPGFCCHTHHHTSHLAGKLCELSKQAAKPVDFTTEAGLFAQKNIAVSVLGPGDIAQAHQANEGIHEQAIWHMQSIYQNYMMHYLKQT